MIPPPNQERWKLTSRNMEALLADVASHKGESLWQDAWRRLKRNRAAFFSLLFLIAFGLLSFFAPLLPLASPKSLSLRTEASPPSWPWESPQADPEEPPPGGFKITSSVGAFMDNGWRHRTVVGFEGVDGLDDAEITALGELVEEASGRSAVLDRRNTQKDGVQLFVAVPYEHDDEARVDWAPTGATGEATLHLVGGTSAWLELELPADETLFTSWRLDANRRDIYATFEDDAGQQVRYTFRLSRELEASFLGLTLNGRALPPQGQVEDRAAPEAIAQAPLEDLELSLTAMVADQEVALPEFAGGDGDLELVQTNAGKRERLYTRQVMTAVEELGTPHTDLARIIADALADSPLAGAGVTLGELAFEDGYWELSWLDRQLVSIRASIFGLWQTGNWMGTDSKGRDIMSRIVWGSRTSIIVALIATLCSLLIGVTYGSFSGLMGGRIDNFMMRVVDILYSLPFIFVVIFLITIINEYRTELEDSFGIDREVTFYLVIGAIYWLTMARVVRGQVLSLKNSEFIEAARVIGAPTSRILFAHIVPNVLSIVIVYLTLTIPAVMLFEAFLSFLGLGIEPPKVSWGILAVDGTEAINPIRIYWWLVVFPALAMGSTLLALNVLGDGLRDALDPKLRGKD